MSEHIGEEGLNGWIVLGAWVATVGLAYTALGGTMSEVLEGTDRSAIPLLPVAASILALAIALWLTVRWARTRPAPSGLPASGRRQFLTGSAGVVGGLFAFGAGTVARLWGWATITGPALATEVERIAVAPREEWRGAKIRSYRRYGKTGVKVSDIGLGTSQFKRSKVDPQRIAEEAFDRGVTYVDTSADYAGTLSENALGKALVGRRDRIVLATKFCTPDGHVRQGSSVAAYVKSIEDSLVRLKTDHIDTALVHSCDTVERLMDENVHEAFDRLKEAGKVRFLGVSTHTPNLEVVANHAVRSNRFDMMMLAYHHGAWPQVPDIIDRAAAKGMAIVAMKTLKGAKHRGMDEFRGDADAYSQAAFKWVLQNPSISCLVVSFIEMENVDEYVYASGRPMEPDDYAVLDRYDRQIAGKHCFAHCGECLDACPEQLAIHDVLRHRMYFEDYGNEREAMQLYSRLEKQADVCIGCSAPCAGACPFSVPIRERTLGAHEMLTLS